MSAVSLAFKLLGIDQSASSSMEGVADQADETSSRLSAMGAAGIAAAGLVAGAFGVGLVSALDIEPALDKMNADLGATGQFAADLGGIAGSLYADAYGESMSDVTAAIGSVVKSGAVMEGASNEQIQSVTATAMDLATVMGEEVGPMMKAVGQMVRTGLAVDAEHAFDILARGQQQGLNASEDLLDTFNEYGTQFRKLGLDGETALGLISQGLQGGARDADLVADAIKEFSIRAIDGSEATGESFKSIGLDAGEMAAKIAAGGPAAAGALDLTLDKLNAISDPVARNAAGVALFGTQWEDMGAAMQSLDVSSAAAALGDVDGAAARMGETLNDNAMTNLTSFKRQVEMALVSLLGGQVVPAIRAASGWLAENFGPALVMVGGFLSDAGSAMAAFGRWVADNKTPILAVAGVITGILLPSLVMAGTQATISAAKQVAAWVTTGAAATGSAAKQVAAAVVSAAKWVWAGWQATASAAKQVAAWIAIGAISVAQGALQLFSLGITAAQWVATGAAATASAARQAAAWVASGARAAAGMAVQVAALVATGIRWVAAGAMAMASAVVMAAAWFVALGPIGWAIAAIAAAVALIVVFWDDIVKGLKAAGKWIADFFTGLPGMILGFLSNVGGWLLDAGKAILRGLWTGVKWWWDNVLSRFYIDLPLMILGFLADAGSWLLDVGKKILGGLWSGIKWWWDNVLSRFYIDLPLMILGFFASAGSWLLDVGKKILSGLWDGIRWIWDNVLSRFYIDLPLKILGFFVSAVSWLFDKGKDILTGLLNGILNIAAGIGGWLQRNLKDPVFRFFADAKDWLWQKGDDIIRGMLDGVLGVMRGIRDWLRKNVFDKIMGALDVLFEFGSPSRVMMRLGVNLIEGLLKGVIFSARNAPKVLTKAFGGVAGVAKAVLGGALDVGGKLFDAIFGGDVGHLAGPKGAIQQYAMALLQAYGWGNQWRAFNALVMGESGWNPRATNPSSGAYGIPQSLPASKLDAYGNRHDYRVQLRWMLDYIRCMPTDNTEILTRRGWKKFDQIEPGDETIGYNPETGCSEWTRITDVHVYEDAPLIRLSNKTWSATCTPGHRWSVSTIRQTEGRRSDGQGGRIAGYSPSYRVDELVQTDRLTSRHRIRLAALAATGDGPAIDDREAELLGWIMGDGHVQRLKSRTPNSTHWRTKRGCTSVQISIYQSSNKPSHVQQIDSLVAGLIVHRTSRAGHRPDGSPTAPIIHWHLSRPYSAELLKRSGYDHEDPVPFVASLSPSQREAFLRGVFGADGSQGRPSRGFGNGTYPAQVMYSQADGPQQDAITLAVFLNGKRPAIHQWSDASGGEYRRRNGANIGEAKPFIGRAIKREDAGRARVWCPTTDLGTWTARQGRQVFLTGNSRYGTPTAAYAKWLSRSPHWYATGGIFLHPSVIGVGEAGPEAVVPLSRGRDYGLGRGDTYYVVNLTVNGAVGSRDEVVRWVRTGMKEQLRGDGKHELAGMM